MIPSLEFGLQALNPSNQTFADIGIVSQIAEAYGAGVDDLYHELHQAKRLLQRMKVEDRTNILCLHSSLILNDMETHLQNCTGLVLLRFLYLSVLLRVNAASQH